ncbi:MAG: hypothetical protein E7256_03145 [Lachnospiraceae bacterium]|nr:hypothetical protein [Lachnospiraceae bacterium]
MGENTGNIAMYYPDNRTVLLMPDFNYLISCHVTVKNNDSDRILQFRMGFQINHSLQPGFEVIDSLEGRELLVLPSGRFKSSFFMEI